MRFVHLVVDGVVSNETRHGLGLVVVGELVVAEGLVVRVAQLAGDFRHMFGHLVVLVDLHDVPLELAEHVLEVFVATEFRVILLEERDREVAREQSVDAPRELFAASDGFETRRPSQKIGEMSTFGSPQRPTPLLVVDEERTIAERNGRSRLLPFFRHPGGGRGDRVVLDGIFFNCFFHGA